MLTWSPETMNSSVLLSLCLPLYLLVSIHAQSDSVTCTGNGKNCKCLLENNVYLFWFCSTIFVFSLLPVSCLIYSLRKIVPFFHLHVYLSTAVLLRNRVHLSGIATVIQAHDKTPPSMVYQWRTWRHIEVYYRTWVDLQ